MKENWTYKKVKDVCEKASSNIVLNKFENNVGDYALYGASGLVKGVDFYHRDEPYIGIVKDGSGVGRVDVYPAKSSLVGTMQYILPKKDCSLKFLCYALQSLKLSDFVTGAAIPHIYFRDYGECVIPVPPLSTQSRIVSELDLLQSIIDKQKTQLKELDNLAQAIFYDMFGDILESTPTKCLKDVAEYYIGLTYSPNDVADKGTVVLRSSNIQNNVLDFEDTVRVNMTITDKKIVQDGDILMCARNGSARLVGKVARIKNLSEKMSFGAFMTTIRSPYNDYLFQFFLSHYFRNQLTTSKTATINQITTKMLDGIKLNVPSLKLQQSFAQKIGAIERQKDLINQSIREAQTLFDSRMEYYFGE
ncbi:MAG: restriction endonuclease subunit S [Bacteroidales bacterium]|nr:restriction endonuclease subunit S [Bacteroidales bacterium]